MAEHQQSIYKLDKTRVACGLRLTNLRRSKLKDCITPTRLRHSDEKGRGKQRKV